MEGRRDGVREGGRKGGREGGKKGARKCSAHSFSAAVWAKSTSSRTWMMMKKMAPIIPMTSDAVREGVHVCMLSRIHATFVCVCACVRACVRACV